LPHSARTNEVGAGHPLTLRHEHVRSLGVHVVRNNVPSGLRAYQKHNCQAHYSIQAKQASIGPPNRIPRIDIRRLDSAALPAHRPDAMPPAVGLSWSQGMHTCPSPAVTVGCSTSMSRVRRVLPNWAMNSTTDWQRTPTRRAVWAKHLLHACFPRTAIHTAWCGCTLRRKGGSMDTASWRLMAPTAVSSMRYLWTSLSSSLAKDKVHKRRHGMGEHFLKAPSLAYNPLPPSLPDSGNLVIRVPAGGATRSEEKLGHVPRLQLRLAEG
jgi:hypothetical protein